MATITIEVPAEAAQRLSDALTIALQLESPATVDDVTAYIRAELKDLVFRVERRERVRAAAQGDTELVI